MEVGIVMVVAETMWAGEGSHMGIGLCTGGE